MNNDRVELPQAGVELRDEARRNDSLRRHVSDARVALDRALVACVKSAAATDEPGADLAGLYPTDEARIRLRDCVRDYTEAMRSIAEPPEAALKSVKGIVAEVLPAVESYSALACDVSHWCIQAYFETE
jgi:hypothetical protein